MIRVTGGNSLYMTPLSTDTDNGTELIELLTKSSGTSTSASSASSAKYGEVKSSASELNAAASELNSTDSDSVFARAQESGDTTEVVSAIMDMVDKYNALLEDLNDLGTDKADTYISELTYIFTSQAESLENIGISIGKDGTLSVDSDVLSAADLEELEALFYGDDSISDKVEERSMYIGAYATADQYVSSCSSYSSSGTSVDYFQLVNMVGSYLDSLS